MTPLFPLGSLFITPGCRERLDQSRTNPVELITRHLQGDFGDLSAPDNEANRVAIRRGGRIFSCYQLPSGHRVWVITESDRSATTLLLPDEY